MICTCYCVVIMRSSVLVKHCIDVADIERFLPKNDTIAVFSSKYDN